MIERASRFVARLASSAGLAALVAAGLLAGGAKAHVDRTPICNYFYAATKALQLPCPPNYHPARFVRWEYIQHEHYTRPAPEEPRLPDGY